MQNNFHPIIDKIINVNRGTFVIFFTYDCSYCQKALQLLRNRKVPYKGYNINRINGNMQNLLEVLDEYSYITDFNPNHRSKPIVFLNGKFIGGYNELSNILNH